MWILTSPWMLIGLASVPLLVGIYVLRSRARRRTVSSLLLWADQQRARQGGRRVQRLQTPLLFLLEMLVLALLVFAAGGPRMRRSDTAWPTVVVLDDSYSMNAGGESSPRDRAIAALESFIENESGFPMQLIVAGQRPELLAQAVHSPSQAFEAISQWKCRSATADLEAAIALAEIVADSSAKILVVTDHPPAEELGQGRVRWRSFGRPRDNLAIVTASRTVLEDQGRLLVELANLSDSRVSVPLTIAATPKRAPTSEADSQQVTPMDPASDRSAWRVIEKSPQTIDPGETLRLAWSIAASDAALVIDTPADDLAIDNRVLLLPPLDRPVRIRIDLLDESLAKAVEDAARATRQTVAATDRVELAFTDRAIPPGSVDAGMWVVRFVVDTEDDVSSYTGPFVVDRSHPITEGLALDGVIWGAAPSETTLAVPIISAGNVPLVTELPRPDGARGFRIHLRAEMSTLLQSPNWPILVSNLIRWRMVNKPGLLANHFRLGSEVHYRAGNEEIAVTVDAPSGRSHEVAIHDGRAVYRPASTGYHELRANAGREAFTVSTLQRDESDLRRARGGDWGSWLDETTTRRQYRAWAWTLILAALALLTLHLALISAAPQGGRS